MKQAKVKKSQKDNVKEYLESGKRITPLEALGLFGVFRLSAIIYTLRWEYDMNIVTDIKRDVNNKPYASYTLEAGSYIPVAA